ncbi:hypothetical protein KEM52_003808, partial [Ascosphaera acerosa]
MTKPSVVPEGLIARYLRQQPARCLLPSVPRVPSGEHDPFVNAEQSDTAPATTTATQPAATTATPATGDREQPSASERAPDNDYEVEEAESVAATAGNDEDESVPRWLQTSGDVMEIDDGENEGALQLRRSARI